MVDHGGHAGSAIEPIIQVKAKTANDHKIPFLVNGAAEVSVGSIALSLVHRTVALRAVVRYRSPCLRSVLTTFAACRRRAGF